MTHFAVGGLHRSVSNNSFELLVIYMKPFSCLCLGILAVFVPLQMGCTSEAKGLSDRLAAMPLTGLAGMQALNVLNLPNEAYVCVLPPYHDAVEGSSGLAKEISDYLQQRDFRGDEGSWTILYRIENAWHLEKISRRDFELSPSTASNENESVCGRIDQLRIAKLNEKKVSFVLKGKTQ
ncbi:MAG: hypothetical protein Q8M77_04430 [Hydrogenophaga sp.]|nr:hypothetical protein [Hydrogenophaga sp.]